MSSLQILITAGPTQEPLDDVRFLSNASSGAMGYALANIFQKNKFRVTLISGPTSLQHPHKVKFVAVKTALEMFAAVKKNIGRADVFISTAAVSDFRFKKVIKGKIKKDQLILLEAFGAGLTWGTALIRMI